MEGHSKQVLKIIQNIIKIFYIYWSKLLLEVYYVLSKRKARLLAVNHLLTEDINIFTEAQISNIFTNVMALE
jgi:hypothetical protein